MKKNLLIMCAMLMSHFLFAQDPNIVINMNGPTYGIGIKANFPTYTGSWARGFFVNNEDGGTNLFGIGALGNAVNGSASLIKGWIGKSWADSYMNFLSNGNVGIGTESPSEKLAVNGNIRAKEVKVETANWPDYVFEEDYKILGLTELERFIKINKHLPDVPSASIIEQDGLNLGEMNKVLLKKIEELTLHLIQKDKDFKILQKQQAELNAKFLNLLNK